MYTSTEHYYLKSVCVCDSDYIVESTPVLSIDFDVRHTLDHDSGHDQ